MLTKKQEIVLKAIQRFHKKKGIYPSLSEILEEVYEFPLRNKTVAYKYVLILQREKYIKRDKKGRITSLLPL